MTAIMARSVSAPAQARPRAPNVLAEQISMGLPVKLHFAVLTKHKSPVVQLIPVATDPGRVEILKQSVSQIWTAIQSGNFYTSPSPQNCTGCPFRSRCPVFVSKR
jgi:CRISPR/Cas system-associated exonuclease Cas4 (RecB family)